VNNSKFFSLKKSMKKQCFFLIVFTCLVVNLSQAQQYNKCGFKIPKKRAGSIQNQFASTYEARFFINQILTAIAWKPNFVVEELPPGTNNAYASFKYGKRYIEYDNSFCEFIDMEAGTKWASISILAHEIGHHYYNHVFDGLGSTPPKELEADFLSGFAMAKLGATLEQAKAAMQEIADLYGSRTHPPQDQRLAAIENGWCKAMNCDKNNEENNNAAEWINLHNLNSFAITIEFSDDGRNYQKVVIKPNEKFTFKYEIYNYGWIRLDSGNGCVITYTLGHGKRYKVEFNKSNNCLDVFDY